MQKPIVNYEQVIEFGKHKGKTIDWIAENHPDYIVWLHENQVCVVDEKILDAAIADDMNNSPPEDFFWEPD